MGDTVYYSVEWSWAQTCKNRLAVFGSIDENLVLWYDLISPLFGRGCLSGAHRNAYLKCSPRMDPWNSD